ncbi:hypothetical protein [Longimicrobium terrae]|uniref:Lipoprotein n=1 Tax=Longimicrobium terrae TaxID=1639882 RepID=A0A841GZX1_9BACT|nr:hypothetical protein [Longimicrobium terrae]MBB4637072.1 hypothetical protein [Longimicrobium terrae]MBB6071320.1 hypothetical protein [Longimicrobium terrae]NNC31461.1 hypothetical protein [Longimicrobium terrae]
MNRMIPLLPAALAALSGCAIFSRTEPVVLRRYATHTVVQDSASAVRITVFALPVPAAPSTATVLTSLSPEAQAEMVKAMAARTGGDARALVQALALPIREASSTPSFQDRTRISRRLVFSLDHSSSSAADRISDARIIVRPVNGSQFVSWNRIENPRETVDVGKLSLSRERNTGAELGLALPFLSATPSLSASAATTLQEEMVLRRQRTPLTGTLTATEAVLLQQGDIETDLSGNITADFDMVVPHGGYYTVFTASLPDACGGAPSFNRQTTRYAAAGLNAPSDTGRGAGGPAPVGVNVELQYTLRHVPAGDRTLPEGDDAAEFRKGRDTIRLVEILPGEALRFAVFQLRIAGDSIEIEGAAPSARADRRNVLEFGTFEEAVDMLAWIRRCTVAKLGYPLWAGNRAMTDGDRAAMHVWRAPVNYKGDEGELPLRR